MLTCEAGKDKPSKLAHEACFSRAHPTISAELRPPPMRSLLEVAVLAAVVALAWEKSISQRVGEAIPALHPALAATSATRAPALRAQPAAATASERGAWMWDPNRRSGLDRPA